jgi:hypothetical protein
MNGNVNFYGHASCATYAANATTAIRAIQAASAAYATKALNDVDNNPIKTTYLKVADFDATLMATDAMQFKGTLGTTTDGGTVQALPTPYSQGDAYKVVTAGTYAGKVCEIGDLIIALKDASTLTNSDWVVVQSNIDGAVTGPANAVDG